MLLALGSAVGYGLSDVLGGLLARRVPFVRVALLGQVGGLIVTALLAPLLSAGVPGGSDLAWGALSGVGTGLAMTFLFRGIGRGAMSIVVPISAVGGVALPVGVGVAVLGERPAPQAWAGIALAVVALWAVSRGPGGGGRSPRAAIGDGLVAGAGIAVQYLALARAGPGSGIWAVVAGRATAIVTVVAVGAALGLAASTREITAGRRVRTGIAAAAGGALAGLALVCYLLATRAELLTVAVVLSSLYPALPVLLGITLLRERLGRAQAAGVGGVLAAAVLIALA